MHTDTVIRPMVWVRQPRHEEDKGPDKVPQLITDLAEFKCIHPDPEPGPVASCLPVGAGEGQHRAHPLRCSLVTRERGVLINHTSHPTAFLLEPV